jgi:hypothetical protein
VTSVRMVIHLAFPIPRTDQLRSLRASRLSYMDPWLFLILSLPTENSTARMRAWRALKASGAAVLRDGVYVLPDREPCRTLLDTVALDVRAGGGVAHLIRGAGEASDDFAARFDRSHDYADLLRDIAKAQHGSADDAADVTRQTRRLRKAYASLAEIDFFPGEAQRQAESALQDLEAHAIRMLSPNEPHRVERAIPRLDAARYRGKLWATRERPWVDRLASAWLIRRYIDPQARFAWLKSAAECPSDAVGFDFDGAVFTHVGARVTFEVLLAAFGLEQPALQRLGAVVHYLDIGGIQPPEARGVECVLGGLRESVTADDRLLTAAGAVFDALLVGFENGGKSGQVDGISVDIATTT